MTAQGYLRKVSYFRLHFSQEFQMAFNWFFQLSLKSFCYKNHYYNYSISFLPLWVGRKQTILKLKHFECLNIQEKTHQHFFWKKKSPYYAQLETKSNLIFAMRSFTLPKVSGSVFRQSAVERPCQMSLFISTSILFSDLSETDRGRENGTRGGKLRTLSF